MDEKSNNLPIVIIIIALAVLFAYILAKRKVVTQSSSAGQTSRDAKKNPCEGIPDWACGIVSVVNPLATASVDVFKAQTQADIQKARLK